MKSIDNKALLSTLVKSQDFADENSISYNAGMYLLISLLEENIKKDRSRKRTVAEQNIETLRNGLVHGFTSPVANQKIKCEYVKKFVEDLESYKFDFNKVNFANSDLFKLLKERAGDRKSIDRDKDLLIDQSEAKISRENAIQENNRVKVEVIRSRQEEMRKQQRKINKFIDFRSRNEKFSDYAILYAAGCFCEASEHVTYTFNLSKAEKEKIKFDGLKEIRDKIFHIDQDFIEQIDDTAKVIQEHEAAFKIKYGVEETQREEGVTSKVQTSGKKEIQKRSSADIEKSGQNEEGEPLKKKQRTEEVELPSSSSTPPQSQSNTKFDQILSCVKKVVSNLERGSLVEKEISNAENLKEALESKIDKDQHRVIMLKVDANGGFTNDEKGSHNVALVIYNNGSKNIIKYLDPTNTKISKNVKKEIGKVLGQNLEIIHPKIELEHGIELTQKIGPILASLVAKNGEATNNESKIIITNKDVEGYKNRHFRLSTKSDLKKTTQTPVESSEFISDLKSEAESTTKKLEAFKKRIQKRKMPDKKLEEPEAPTQEHVDAQKSHLDQLRTQKSGGRRHP